VNLYFLLEGKRTEKRLYGSWLPHLLPSFSRVDFFDDVESNNYFLFSGEGYPSLLDRHLPNAVQDISQSGRYSHLVVCLDADECTTAEREKEVYHAIACFPKELERTRPVVVVQNRCIETWLLGNRRVVSRNPQSETLRRYRQFYDVIDNDPELMGIHPDFSLHAPFHHDYLRVVFRERSLRYDKARPGHACERTFLTELQRRVEEAPHELRSLGGFLNFCTALQQAASQ
jgi:hypothetical protein